MRHIGVDVLLRREARHMEVKLDMIDKQLRFRGRLFRAFWRNRSEESFRKGNGLIFALVRALGKPKDLRVDEEWIPRKDGSRERIFVYRSLELKDNVPGILWPHGGGYVMGIPEQEVVAYRQLIGASGCVVVAPDYRLGGEAPYPAALEDCYDALLWLKDNASRLGIRDDQIAVGGGSAGGGLTAALTLYARDKGDVNIAFQMPIYPMIDDRSMTESARENNAPVWDATTNRSAWKVYLGKLYGTPDVPPYAAAARATDYSNLPPTLTYVGDIEPFRDETIKYVENLRAAGVPVEFEIFKGCYHGFDGICPNANVSKRAAEFRMKWFHYAVQNYFAPQPGKGERSAQRSSVPE
jgi:acetyl esterase/lipase